MQKFLPTLFFGMVAVFFFVLNGQPVVAFQSEDAANKDIAANFKKIGELVEEDKIEEAAKLMTERGADGFITDPIIQALYMASEPSMDDLSDDIPAEVRDQIEAQIKEQLEAQAGTRKEVNKLLKEFGLEEFKLDGDAFDMSPKDFEEIGTKILATLDKAETRFKACRAFKKALEGFDMNLFKGEMGDEIEVDGKNASVSVKPDFGDIDGVSSGEEGEADDEMEMKTMIPPMFVRFKQSDKGWLFDGLDIEKTEEASQEFMEEMGAMDGFDEPARRKSDF